MNHIKNKFKQLKSRKQKAFIAFITAGDPDLLTTEKLVYAFEKAGVDAVELGVAFSDPLADGPTIQAASQRALKCNVNLKKILELVARIRCKSQIPIALMTYYNPVFHFGEEKFIQAAKNAGVDGLIIPDLPPEEAKNLVSAARKKNISTVFFIAPTTTESRLEKIVQASSGFIYYVSLTGVTGARSSLPQTIAGDIKRARRFTTKPICVGFGISTPQHVRAVGRIADGVIVGSAIIQEIQKNEGKKNLVTNVAKYVGKLVKALN